MQNISSKDILEKVANSVEDNLEINKNNQINININNSLPKKDNLTINSNNNIQVPNQVNQVKENNLEISNSNNIINININSSPKKNQEKKDNFQMSKSNTVEIDDSNIKINPNLSLNNKNSIEISPQNKGSRHFKSVSQSQITIEQISNRHLKEKRLSAKSQKALIENNNYDYYSLFHEEYVLKKLNELKDNANESSIYSDQIFLLTNGKKLEKRLILLTPSHIYIIEPKEPQFILIMEKAQLEKIAISNLNLNILMFIRHKAESIIILTLRRMDLLNYIKQFYYKSEKPIRFIYEDSFKIRVKGKETLLTVKDKIFTTLSNFDGAIKIGYLLKQSHFILKTFNERLVVLTSIGLIIFNDPMKPPERLYPIIGSKIVKVIGNKYKRPNCFEILTPNGETKVFAAYKERDLKSWLEEFDRVKKDFANKMKQLDTVNKKEFIENKNNLYDVQEEDFEDEILPDDENKK